MRSPAAFLEPVVSFSFFIFRYSIVFNSFPSSIFAIACGASLPTMSATSIRLRKMCGIVTMYETGIVSAATDGRQRRTDGKKNAQSTHSTAGMHTCSGSGGGPPPACKGMGGSRSIAVAAAPRLGARWRRRPQRRRRAAGRRGGDGGDGEATLPHRTAQRRSTQRLRRSNRTRAQQQSLQEKESQ